MGQIILGECQECCGCGEDTCCCDPMPASVTVTMAGVSFTLTPIEPPPDCSYQGSMPPICDCPSGVNKVTFTCACVDGVRTATLWGTASPGCFKAFTGSVTVVSCSPFLATFTGYILEPEPGSPFSCGELSGVIEE